MLTCIDDFGDLPVRAVRDAGNGMVLYYSREVFSEMGCGVQGDDGGGFEEGSKMSLEGQQRHQSHLSMERIRILVTFDSDKFSSVERNVVHENMIPPHH